MGVLDILRLQLLADLHWAHRRRLEIPYVKTILCEFTYSCNCAH